MHESLRSLDQAGALSEDEQDEMEWHDSSLPVRGSTSNNDASMEQDGNGVGKHKEENERLLDGSKEHQQRSSRSIPAGQERAARYGAAAELDLKLDKSDLRKRRRSSSIKRDPNQRVSLGSCENMWRSGRLNEINYFLSNCCAMISCYR